VRLVPTIDLIWMYIRAWLYISCMVDV